MFSNLKISILFGRLAHQRLIFTYNDPRCIAVRQTHNHHYTNKQRKLAGLVYVNLLFQAALGQFIGLTPP